MFRRHVRIIAPCRLFVLDPMFHCIVESVRQGEFAVYKKEDLVRSMVVMNYDVNNVSDDSLINKYKNLIMLNKEGYNVPECIYICPDEFLYYISNDLLSNTLVQAIEEFESLIVSNGYMPLFSIRAENKSYNNLSSTIPSTLINIGINSIYQKYCNSKEWGHVIKIAQESYLDRLKPYQLKLNKKTFDSKTEILQHLILIYELMKKQEGNYSKGIILQRMVFGNKDDSSGMGICCDWPGEETENTCFKGVFLPQHHGCPLIKGSWGYNEVDLSDLRFINAYAYAYIKDVYHYYKNNHFKNPYIEFTAEKNKVYILQIEDRQRYVRSTM